ASGTVGWRGLGVIVRRGRRSGPGSHQFRGHVGKLVPVPRDGGCVHEPGVAVVGSLLKKARRAGRSGPGPGDTDTSDGAVLAGRLDVSRGSRIVATANLEAGTDVLDHRPDNGGDDRPVDCQKLRDLRAAEADERG